MTGDYKANKYIFSHTDHIGISIRVKKWKGHSLERDLWEHKVHKRTPELACLGWCVRVEAAGPSVILTALSQYFTMKWQQSVAYTHTHFWGSYAC